MLKVGLYGHYGYGEFCDDYIEMAIKSTFNNLCNDKIEWVRLRGQRPSLDVVILGGGSLLGRSEAKLVDMLKEKEDTPFYIYGAGVRDIEASGDLQYLCNRASLIAVRGKSSSERLEEQGVDMSKVVALGDPIFLCPRTQKQDGGYIGGVYRPYKLKPEVMGDVFEWLKRKRSQDIKLFSFAKDQGDGEGGLGYDIHALDIHQTYKGLIQSSFWFGNRLHPFCIALMQSIPTIGLEIEFQKVEDVCSTLDYPFWLNNSDFNSDSFEDMYFELLVNYEKIDKKVQMKITEIRKRLCGMAERILKEVKE